MDIESYSTRFVLNYSYIVVDAAMEAMFEALERHTDTDEDSYTTRHQRQKLNDGCCLSVLYFMHEGQRFNFLGIEYRAVANDRTLFQIAPPPAYYNDPKIPSIIRTMKWRIHDYLIQQDEEMKTLVETKLIPLDEGDTSGSLAQGLSLSARGRPVVSHNEWARNEVLKKGRPQSEVFREYLSKLGIDSNNIDELNLARDRFRQALKRRPKTSGRK